MYNSVTVRFSGNVTSECSPRGRLRKADARKLPNDKLKFYFKYFIRLPNEWFTLEAEFIDTPRVQHKSSINYTRVQNDADTFIVVRRTCDEIQTIRADIENFFVFNMMIFIETND